MTLAAQEVSTWTVTSCPFYENSFETYSHILISNYLCLLSNTFVRNVSKLKKEF